MINKLVFIAIMTTTVVNAEELPEPGLATPAYIPTVAAGLPPPSTTYARPTYTPPPTYTAQPTAQSTPLSTMISQPAYPDQGVVYFPPVQPHQQVTHYESTATVYEQLPDYIRYPMVTNHLGSNSYSVPAISINVRFQGRR